MPHPSAIAAALAAKRCPPVAVLDHIADGDDVIVGAANAEPLTVLDAIEAAPRRWRDVRLHQMLPLRSRRYIDGGIEGLRHVSWFLSPPTREAFHRGACDLVPNNFSEVPRLFQRATKCSLVVISVAPPDRHGYFSLGVEADYSAALIGHAPFFIEVNHQMPRTFGANQVHVSQIVGWCEADYALTELPAPPISDLDRRIAALVAEQIPDGATLQIGIGAVPAQVLTHLTQHKELGVHSELFGSGFVDLVEAGVITGTRKCTHPGKMIVTAVLGDQRLYAFVDENPGIEFWPVNYTNEPRNIALERNMVAVNATLEVDFLGQCASESLGSSYWSGSGGQTDFARGATFAENGQSFIVLHASTHDEALSRIVPQLHPGAAVTTYKNIVDRVVTEYGIAELRGSSIRERTRRLIAIAHPKFREELEEKGRELGYL
jgi:acyl-CoA hydrolase